MTIAEEVDGNRVSVSCPCGAAGPLAASVAVAWRRWNAWGRLAEARVRAALEGMRRQGYPVAGIVERLAIDAARWRT
jgi:hypothetical protein